MKAFVALAIACALAACDGTLGDTSTVREAKHAVAGLLKDPSSAQFEGVTELGSCVEGKVNAKNEFGGYTGFVEFGYSAYSKAAAIDPGDITPIHTDADVAHNQARLRYLDFKFGCSNDAGRQAR